MARTPAPGTRQRILDTAGRLFREHGVRAVGLQQIIDECGCGKNLLYREFPSKDELVAAHLDRCHHEWAAIMEEATQPYADDPAGKLIALVRAAVRQVDDPGFRRCPFRAAHAEFAGADHPGRRVPVSHVTDLRVWLRQLAQQAGAGDPGTLADRLALIIDGVYVNGAMLGVDGAASAATAFAEELVQSSIERSG
jgi:AcrR family transcriptional regulator